MTLEPLFSRILVKRKEVNKVGSIYVPIDSREMKATQGEVLAIGNEVSSVIVGDNIYFGKYSGAEIEFENEKFIIMNEEDILCKII